MYHAILLVAIIKIYLDVSMTDSIYIFHNGTFNYSALELLLHEPPALCIFNSVSLTPLKLHAVKCIYTLFHFKDVTCKFVSHNS